eukprot:gene22849-31147_t
MEEPISLAGVSLLFIRKFIDNYSNEFNFRELSTTQVNHLIVQVKTRDCKKPFYYYVQNHTSGDDSVKWNDSRCSPNRYFSKATVFVSHAWADSFFELVETLEKWQAKNGREEYFWIDNFIINQHETEKSFDWWTKLFKQSVVDIGRALMVMNPWNAPVYTTRAWCLYEFSIIVESKIPYDIILSPTQNTLMVEAFKSGSVTFTGKGYILNHLNQIDIQKAEAYKKSDLDSILSMVLSGVGFRELNRRIIGALQDWIIDSAIHICFSMDDKELARSPLPENLAMPCGFTGKLAEYIELMRKVTDCQSRVLGQGSSSTLFSLLIYCIELQLLKANSLDITEVTEAWSDFERRITSTVSASEKTKSVSSSTSVLRRDGIEQVARFWQVYNRSQTMCCFNNGNAAKETLKEWKGVRSAMGSFHPFTILTFIRLSSFVLLWNPSDSSYVFSIIRTIKYYASVFYLSLEKHELSRILLSYLSDGIVAINYHRKEYLASQVVYRRLKAKLLVAEEQLGTIHLNSAAYGITLFFLVYILFQIGEHDSVLQYSKDIDFSSRCTISVSRLLFTLLHCYRGRSLAHMGRFEEAEKLFRKFLALPFPPELGQGDNPLLPVIRMYLAETLLLRGDLDGLKEAEDLSRDCFRKLEKHFGKGHQLTLDSLEIRAAVLDGLGWYAAATELLKEYRRRVQALIRLRRWGM